MRLLFCHQPGTGSPPQHSEPPVTGTKFIYINRPRAKQTAKVRTGVKSLQPPHLLSGTPLVSERGSLSSGLRLHLLPPPVGLAWAGRCWICLFPHFNIFLWPGLLFQHLNMYKAFRHQNTFYSAFYCSLCPLVVVRSCKESSTLAVSPHLTSHSPLSQPRESVLNIDRGRKDRGKGMEGRKEGRKVGGMEGTMKG